MIRRIVPWLIFAIFGFYLIGTNFQAKMGKIDDHEIEMFLGSDGKINIVEIPKVIAGTEVGKWGKYERFRPSYYTLRVIESSLWRDNAFLWYATRYVMLVVVMGLGYLILARILPKLIAMLSIFYLLTLPMWADVLTRLGPSEIYAAVGVTMFGYGLITQLDWLWFVGYLIAVGSKENLLFLLPVLGIWFLIQIIQKKVTTKQAILAATAIAYTVWILGGIVLATRLSGTDVYGTNISYVDRLKLLWSHKRYIIETQHLLFAAVVSLGMLVESMVRRKNPKYFWIMLMLGVIVASQYIFYDNTLPTNMRYDFPGVVVMRLLNIIPVAWMLELVKDNKRQILIKAGLVGLMAGILGFQIFRHGYTPIRLRAIVNKNQTLTFEQTLNPLISKLKSNPDKTLVMVSDYYLDYEPIVSISRFLRAKGVSNTIALDYRIVETDPQNSLKLELEDELIKVREGGAVTEVFSNFEKYDQTETDCYSITFQKRLESNCELVATF